jgi:hypothetical protein
MMNHIYKIFTPNEEGRPRLCVMMDEVPFAIQKVLGAGMPVRPFQICYPTELVTLAQVMAALEREIPGIWRHLTIRQNGILTEVPCPTYKGQFRHLLIYNRRDEGGG